MELQNRFTALQLAIINDQAAIYNCACPVHVSMQITNLRKLYDYQKMCLEEDKPTDNSVEMRVHQRIAEVAKQAHKLMEQCLDEILDMEEWDKTKLEMPAGIRKLKDQAG